MDQTCEKGNDYETGERSGAVETGVKWGQNCWNEFEIRPELLKRMCCSGGIVETSVV